MSLLHSSSPVDLIDTLARSAQERGRKDTRNTQSSRLREEGSIARGKAREASERRREELSPLLSLSVSAAAAGLTGIYCPPVLHLRQLPLPLESFRLLCLHLCACVCLSASLARRWKAKAREQARGGMRELCSGLMIRGTDIQRRQQRRRWSQLAILAFPLFAHPLTHSTDGRTVGQSHTHADRAIGEMADSSPAASVRQRGREFGFLPLSPPQEEVAVRSGQAS